ncbi:Ankyrin repeat family protein [Prunus dulcis]|uniref:Ankyrin repeat family protein n=1 Tax=Prunus dulcis TaxID=3755 RepID=A0A4Y1R168_PRUDU|nr:Ankyrin repeat family protein [Prunus dulcis]
MFGPLDRTETHMSDLIRRGRSMTLHRFGSPGSVGICYHCSSFAGPRGGWSRGVPAPVSSASSVAQPASARRRHRPTTPSTRHRPTVLVPRDHSQKNTRGPCRQLKTAKVTWVTNSRISIGYDERHRAAPTAELHSSLATTLATVMPDEIKAEVRGQLSTNYNLEDLDEESLTYVNRLFAESRSSGGFPKELEGREDSWEWLCAHFQAPEFANKAQVNKGNRKKKTLLHHSGSRPFSYRMDARRREGSKFPEIDVFGDVYVRPGNELAESLHTTMVERSQLVLQESASQLPPETPIESVAPPQDAGFQITETLDQTLGRRPGTYCRGMGNARRREPRLVHRRSQTVSHCFDSTGGHS